MQMGARVESIEALAVFRVALIKFQEAAVAAMGDAESDVGGVIRWLENDQFSYWSSQIRSRQEALARAQEALRQKQIFKDSSGRTPSAVEEQKAVAKALARMQEAQEKMAAVKMWAKRLQKESLLYKGQVQRFATSVSSDIPAAIGHLGALIHTLQEYAAMQPGKEVEIDPSVASFFTEGGSASMSRGQAPAVETRPYVNLRARAPSAEGRANAPAAQPLPVKWAVVKLTADEQKTLGELKVAWTAPAPTDKVILAHGASQSQRIFMDRGFTAVEGDSGWFIGSLDPGQPALESITVAELLATRPDWDKLLALPPGYLAVIDRPGMAAVLDEKEENLWSAAKQPVSA